jgi:hypothetical protein
VSAGTELLFAKRMACLIAHAEPCKSRRRAVKVSPWQPRSSTAEIRCPTIPLVLAMHELQDSMTQR